MDTAPQTDEEVAVLVQRGEGKLFGVLVARYERQMLRYARRFLFGYQDAEDTVQEVFIKAFINIRGFDASRAFSPWLYRVAHNVFINAIKKRGREPISFFDPDTLFPHPVARDNPETDLDRRQTRDALEKSLGQLDPKYREPLVLHFFEDLDYKRISEIMRVPVSTVGVRIMRGKMLLKKYYDELHS